MNYHLELKLDDQQKDQITRHLGLDPGTLTQEDVSSLIIGWVMQGFASLESKDWTVKQMEAAVLDAIHGGCVRGNIPLRGLTDAELAEEIPHVKEKTLRWTRYNLTKRGKLKLGGERTSGKFWIEREIDTDEIEARIKKITDGPATPEPTSTDNAQRKGNMGMGRRSAPDNGGDVDTGSAGYGGEGCIDERTGPIGPTPDVEDR